MAEQAPSLKRDVTIPKEVASMLRLLGVNLPDNVKEISTPVEESDETQKIILPKGMDKLTASKELKVQWEAEETKTDSIAEFGGWNWKDVLVAIKRVTEREMGWMNGQTVHSFFGPIRPKEIDIVIDVRNGKTFNEKAFFGKYQITGWESAECQTNIDDNGVVQVKITAKKKYSRVITNYFNMIREQLSTDSIYRGKSIAVTHVNGRLDFEIIENKGSDMIILNRAEQLTVDTFVIGSLGERGKRCYLFTGSYGTGKTETAMKVGREAVKKGMSFFYLKDSSAFDTLLNESKKYQPAVIFLEDLDEIGSGTERDEHMNRILNILDGVQTKGNDLTVIFTTNHPEKINSALRRPGRIDLMVKFENPDKESVKEIYFVYLKDLYGAGTLDYEKLAELTPAVQGAVVAEIAKRAHKLASKNGEITNDTVEACIHSMRYQIDMMNDAVTGESTDVQFVRLLQAVISDAVC